MNLFDDTKDSANLRFINGVVQITKDNMKLIPYDEFDSDANNPFVCSDNDSDSCDDCSSGSFNPGDDGFDYRRSNGLLEFALRRQKPYLYLEPRLGNLPDRSKFPGETQLARSS